MGQGRKRGGRILFGKLVVLGSRRSECGNWGRSALELLHVLSQSKQWARDNQSPRDQRGEYRKELGCNGSWMQSGQPGRMKRASVWSDHYLEEVSLCLGRLCQDSPDPSECFPLSGPPFPRSAGKPELAVKCFALAPPSSWARTRAVMAAHAGCGHPSPFLLCKASESSCTLLEGGSGLTTAGMTV